MAALTGQNPACLELYLKDADFEEVFGLPKVRINCCTHAPPYPCCLVSLTRALISPTPISPLERQSKFYELKRWKQRELKRHVNLF